MNIALTRAQAVRSAMPQYRRGPLMMLAAGQP